LFERQVEGVINGDDGSDSRTAGFILQRALDITGPWTTAKICDQNEKKLVMGFISLIVGCLISVFGDIRMALDVYCQEVSARDWKSSAAAIHQRRTERFTV
jgi:hypothetical protein